MKLDLGTTNHGTDIETAAGKSTVGAPPKDRCLARVYTRTDRSATARIISTTDVDVQVRGRSTASERHQAYWNPGQLRRAGMAGGSAGEMQVHCFSPHFRVIVGQVWGVVLHFRHSIGRVLMVERGYWM